MLNFYPVHRPFLFFLITLGGTVIGSCAGHSAGDTHAQSKSDASPPAHTKPKKSDGIDGLTLNQLCGWLHKVDEYDLSVMYGPSRQSNQKLQVTISGPEDHRLTPVQARRWLLNELGRISPVPLVIHAAVSDLNEYVEGGGTFPKGARVLTTGGDIFEAIYYCDWHQVEGVENMSQAQFDTWVMKPENQSAARCFDANHRSAHLARESKGRWMEVSLHHSDFLEVLIQSFEGYENDARAEEEGTYDRVSSCAVSDATTS